MRMYNSLMSPFGARVAIATRLKGLDIERLPMSGATLRGPEFRKVNPIGKIPVLLTENGLTLPESETILRYLEDRHPEPALLPADPEQRARMNLLIRVTDLYVMAPVIRLFPHLDPSTRDETIAAYEIAHWRDGLEKLAHFLGDPPAGLTLADCVLPPSLHLCHVIAQMMGLGDMLAPHPTIADYYAKATAHPAIGGVLAALTEAQQQHRAA